MYRRTDEDLLRDRAGRATWLADLLLAPVRRGTLAVVNPFGAGLADDKLVHAYVEEMVRFYLDEQPLLGSVRTLDLSDDAIRAEALDSLGELVVKPRSGYGGAGVVVCRSCDPAELESLARDIERSRRSSSPRRRSTSAPTPRCATAASSPGTSTCGRSCSAAATWPPPRSRALRSRRGRSS